MIGSTKLAPCGPVSGLDQSDEPGQPGDGATSGGRKSCAVKHRVQIEFWCGRLRAVGGDRDHPHPDVSGDSVAVAGAFSRAIAAARPLSHVGHRRRITPLPASVARRPGTGARVSVLARQCYPTAAGEDAHEGRGATDRRQHGAAAGAAREGGLTVDPAPTSGRTKRKSPAEAEPHPSEST
jgi:hypothetical protein